MATGQTYYFVLASRWDLKRKKGCNSEVNNNKQKLSSKLKTKRYHYYKIGNFLPSFCPAVSSSLFIIINENIVFNQSWSQGQNDQ